MAESVKTFVPRAELENAETIMTLLASLTQEQQKDLLSFLRGVAFGQALVSQ